MMMSKGRVVFFAIVTVVVLAHMISYHLISVWNFHKVASELHHSKKHNAKLMSQISLHRNINSKDKLRIENGTGARLRGPSLEHEEYKRKLARDVREWWMYNEAKMTNIVKSSHNASIQEQAKDILTDGAAYYRTLAKDLAQLDGADQGDSWRTRESKRLGRIVQRRISNLQNPRDCKNARKLVCDMSQQKCGYGCMMHHAVYCLIMAYASGRTLILRSKNWPKGGWEKVFLPVSFNCTSIGSPSVKWWSEINKNSPVVIIPLIARIKPRIEQLPPTIPEDIAYDLRRFHGNPMAWWLGQFAVYLIRLQPGLQKQISIQSKKLGFKHPIVGVHVRRTDKLIWEAKLHTVAEYMKHVEEYYSVLSQKQAVDQKRVFLATDEIKVIHEAKKKYPGYTFITSVDIPHSVFATLPSIVLDIHFLSSSDFLVCTFSSNVGRLAYIMMQTRFGDASSYGRSIDDFFFFHGQTRYQAVANGNHVPRSRAEIALKVGDIVGVSNNLWNGYSIGTNLRTGSTGQFLSYKVTYKIPTAKFGIYGNRKT